MPLLDRTEPYVHPPTDLAIIGFIGCDGVGTTTHAEYATELFESHGLTVHNEWMRYEHYFSLPVLALGRLLRKTEVYGDPDNYQVPVHQFQNSRLLENLYKYTLLKDQKRMVSRKFKSTPNDTDALISDRFILDGLVDLAVSLKDVSLLDSHIGQEFWELVPSQAVLIGLDCDADTIASRRPDVAPDPWLELRVEAYRKVFEDNSINVVDTSQPIDEAKREVERIIEAKS
ncbi:nucleoside/nucleotide kinase family protein [Halalkalicoccus salilacus]|uniref:hypothetical protein n=1 Tax=Halalkalicoccus salilacus TaxID=3117459 RepID=UPI00300F5423